MKRALIISSRYPFAYFGGDSTRTKNLIQYCQNLGYQVDLLSFSNERFISTDSNFNINSNYIIFNKLNFSNILFMIRSAFLGIPLQCSYYINNSTKPILKSFDFNKYDLIIIFLIRLYPILQYIKSNQKIIFDIADILTINYKNAWKAKGQSFLWKIIYFIEYFLIRSLEKSILKLQLIKTIVSKRDFIFAKKNFDININNLFVLPSHVELNNRDKILSNAKKKQYESKEFYNLCFIGNMKANHNYSSIVSLINSGSIKLLLKQKIRLYVIGLMNEKINYYLTSNSIFTIPNPENILMSASHCHCGISTLDHCSGLQNKFYDYALLGIPIVASQDSADGIGFLDNHHYLKANNKSEFYTQIIRLKNNPELAIKLVDHTLDYIIKEFSKPTILNKFNSVIHCDD